MSTPDHRIIYIRFYSWHEHFYDDIRRHPTLYTRFEYNFSTSFHLDAVCDVMFYRSAEEEIEKNSPSQKTEK